MDLNIKWLSITGLNSCIWMHLPGELKVPRSNLSGAASHFSILACKL